MKIITLFSALSLGCMAGCMAGCVTEQAPAEAPVDDDSALTARMDALESQHAADVAALEARIAALESENTAITERLDAVESDNASLLTAAADAAEAIAEVETRLGALESSGGSSTAALSRLSEVLSVDSGGDLFLDGVNLWIRSGAGATDAAPNGKGNLILGYSESYGTEARTGSHTFIVGPYHSWTAAWGIVAGEQNGLYADGGALIGGFGNTVTHANAVDAGGTGVTSSYTCGFRGSGLQSGSGC